MASHKSPAGISKCLGPKGQETLECGPEGLQCDKSNRSMTQARQRLAVYVIWVGWEGLRTAQKYLFVNGGPRVSARVLKGLPGGLRDFPRVFAVVALLL